MVQSAHLQSYLCILLCLLSIQLGSLEDIRPPKGNYTFGNGIEDNQEQNITRIIYDPDSSSPYTVTSLPHFLSKHPKYVYDEYEVQEKIDHMIEHYKEVLEHTKGIPRFQRAALIRMSSRNLLLDNEEIWDCKRNCVDTNPENPFLVSEIEVELETSSQPTVPTQIDRNNNFPETNNSAEGEFSLTEEELIAERFITIAQNINFSVVNPAKLIETIKAQTSKVTLPRVDSIVKDLFSRFGEQPNAVTSNLASSPSNFSYSANETAESLLTTTAIEGDGEPTDSSSLQLSAESNLPSSNFSVSAFPLTGSALEVIPNSDFQTSSLSSDSSVYVSREEFAPAKLVGTETLTDTTISNVSYVSHEEIAPLKLQDTDILLDSLSSSAAVDEIEPKPSTIEIDTQTTFSTATSVEEISTPKLDNLNNKTTSFEEIASPAEIVSTASSLQEIVPSSQATDAEVGLETASPAAIVDEIAPNPMVAETLTDATSQVANVGQVSPPNFIDPEVTSRSSVTKAFEGNHATDTIYTIAGLDEIIPLKQAEAETAKVTILIATSGVESPPPNQLDLTETIPSFDNSPVELVTEMEKREILNITEIHQTFAQEDTAILDLEGNLEIERIKEPDNIGVSFVSEESHESDSPIIQEKNKPVDSEGRTSLDQVSTTRQATQNDQVKEAVPTEPPIATELPFSFPNLFDFSVVHELINDLSEELQENYSDLPSDSLSMKQTPQPESSNSPPTDLLQTETDLPTQSSPVQNEIQDEVTTSTEIFETLLENDTRTGRERSQNNRTIALIEETFAKSSVPRNEDISPFAVANDTLGDSQLTVDPFSPLKLTETGIDSSSRSASKSNEIKVLSAFDAKETVVVDAVNEGTVRLIPSEKVLAGDLNGSSLHIGLENKPADNDSTASSQSYLILGFISGMIEAAVIIGFISSFFVDNQQKVPNLFIKEFETNCQNYFQQREYQILIPYVITNLPKAIQSVGEHHLTIYSIKHILAKAEIIIGEIPAALIQLEELLGIYYLYGEDIYVAEIFEDRGIAYEKMQSYSEALFSLHEALRIYSEEALSQLYSWKPSQLENMDIKISSPDRQRRRIGVHSEIQDQSQNFVTEKDEENSAVIEEFHRKSDFFGDTPLDESHDDTATTAVNTSYIDQYHAPDSEQKYYVQNELDRLHREHRELQYQLHQNEAKEISISSTTEAQDASIPADNSFEELTPTVKLHDSNITNLGASNVLNLADSGNNTTMVVEQSHYYRHSLDKEFSSQADCLNIVKELEEFLESSTTMTSTRNLNVSSYQYNLPSLNTSSSSPLAALQQNLSYPPSSSMQIPYYQDLFKAPNQAIVRVCKVLGDVYSQSEQYSEAMIFYCNTYGLLVQLGYPATSPERTELYEMIERVKEILDYSSISNSLKERGERKEEEEGNVHEGGDESNEFTGEEIIKTTKIEELIPMTKEDLEISQLSYYDSYHLH